MRAVTAMQVLLMVLVVVVVLLLLVVIVLQAVLLLLLLLMLVVVVVVEHAGTTCITCFLFDGRVRFRAAALLLHRTAQAAARRTGHRLWLQRQMVIGVDGA